MNSAGVIGLTGGIACGKSEVAGFLSAMGVPVLDTDVVGHRLLEPDHWVYEKVVQEFGRQFVREEGGINRRALGQLVFGNEEARLKLNAIMHPEIFSETNQWVEANRIPDGYIVVVIPLLFENNAESRFEKIIVVSADEQRVMDRLQIRGYSEDEAVSRIKAQMPVEDKISRADYVIRNNGSLEELQKETERIWKTNILGKE